MTTPDQSRVRAAVGEYPASRLHLMAADWLADRYPGALIVHELSVGSWGAALLDVAAITEAEIIGVEIKGDGDSPTRMTLQAAVYSKAATRMFLLPAPSIQDRCFKHTPGCWGRLRVENDTIIRAGAYDHYDPSKEPARLCTAPEQLLQALWREEIARLARDCRVDFGKTFTREELAGQIAEVVPLREIRAGVCTILRDRDWSKFGKPVRWAPKLVEAA